MVQNQNRIRRDRVGDTAQLGNARVDIPIAIRADGNAQRAATAHLEPHPQIKSKVATESIQKSKYNIEGMCPITGATSLAPQSLLF